MRVSNQIAALPLVLRSLGPDDQLVRFEPSSDARRKLPGLPNHLIARLIRYQVPGFRASWLLTSLTDAERFSRDDLIALYHRRWRIETIYGEWKHALDLQNLRSHTPRGLLKEVYAHVLLSNLTRWVMTDATQETSTSPVELSYRTALSLVKTAMVEMAYAPPGRWMFVYQQLLNHVRSAKIRQRPGRSYPRPGDRRIKNRGHGKYQLPSRLSTAKPLA